MMRSLGDFVAFLFIATGSLFAAIGILVLAGRIISGPGEPGSIAWSSLFGGIAIFTTIMLACGAILTCKLRHD